VELDILTKNNDFDKIVVIKQNIRVYLKLLKFIIIYLDFIHTLTLSNAILLAKINLTHSRLNYFKHYNIIKYI